MAAALERPEPAVAARRASSTASSRRTRSTPSSTRRAASGCRASCSTTASSRKDVVVTGAGRLPADLGPRGLGGLQRARSPTSFPTSPPALAILLDMTATHVPVLAGELIELLDPQPGEIAVDCTFGGGGHARLVAERLGPDGQLIADRPRPGRRGALRGARRRGALPRCASSARTSPRRSSACATRASRADLVYLDLGMSSMQVDTRERGFSYAYDAPLDMRMDPDAGARRARRPRQRRGTSAGSPACCASTARSATPAPIARAIVRDRARRRSRRRTSSSRSSSPRSPRRPASRGGHPAKRVFQAIRIAVNDELAQLDARAAARLGRPRAERPICRDFLPFAGRPAREALPRRPRAGVHLPAGPPGLRLRARARGRAAHAPLGRADARRGRRQPARPVRPDARRTQARGAAPDDAARRPPPSRRTARPASRRPRGAAPAAARLRPRPRARAVARRRRAPAPSPSRRRSGCAWPATARRIPDAPLPRPPPPRPRVDRARRPSRSWASSSSRSRCCSLNAGISRAITSGETPERQNAAHAGRDLRARLGRPDRRRGRSRSA